MQYPSFTADDIKKLKYFEIQDDTLRVSSATKTQMVWIYDQWVHNKFIGGMDETKFEVVANNLINSKFNTRILMYTNNYRNTHNVHDSSLCASGKQTQKDSFKDAYAVRSKTLSDIELKRMFINAYFCYMIRLKKYYVKRSHRSVAENMDVSQSNYSEQTSRTGHRHAIDLVHTYLIVLTEIVYDIIANNQSPASAITRYMQSLNLSVSVPTPPITSITHPVPTQQPSVPNDLRHLIKRQRLFRGSSRNLSSLHYLQSLHSTMRLLTEFQNKIQSKK